MNRLVPIIILIFIIACKDEAEISPANESTFMRYYGSENSHTAVLAIEAFDGYTLLSNVNVPVNNGLGEIYKVRMIHTDLYGNTIWTKEYPAFGSEDEELKANTGFIASSFIKLDDDKKGYLIIGHRIHGKSNDGTDSTELLLIQTGASGELDKTLLIPPVNEEVTLKGKAVAVDEGRDYIILGEIIPKKTSKDMFLAKISSNLESIEWFNSYGDVRTSLANRVYYQSVDSITWGGHTFLPSAGGTAFQYDLRLVHSPADSQTSEGTAEIGQTPDFNEIAADFCTITGGYVFAGTNVNPQTQQEDILLTRVTHTGSIISNHSYNFADLKDHGVSVSETADGGVILLATVESSDLKGNGNSDMYLMKFNAVCQPQWGSESEGYGINYGGAVKEEGASVRQTSDGSYLVFGTVTFGNLSKLVLMKVNAKGML